MKIAAFDIGGTALKMGVVVRTAGTGNRPDEGPANAQRRQLVLKMLAEI